MELLTPDLGLIFWQSLVFLLVLFLLSRFAWGPLLGALKEREQSISEALSSAEKAKEEMKNLTAQNEALYKEAITEREKVLRQAKEQAEKIIEAARAEAQVKIQADIDNSRKQIETERKAAIADIKNTVAELSLEIASSVLREKLSTTSAQTDLVEKYITELGAVKQN